MAILIPSNKKTLMVIPRGKKKMQKYKKPQGYTVSQLVISPC